jgi:predicted transcriptional regulator
MTPRKAVALEATGAAYRSATPKKATRAKAPMLEKSPPTGGIGAPLRATTIRLTAENEQGLRLLNSELQRPINKLVNQAVAEFIETTTGTLQHKLEQTLAQLKSYRRRDPGFKKAISQFVDAEASLDDPAEGKRASLPAGPALTTVREALRGR